MTKKLLAITVSAIILLFQAKEVVAPSDGWYWPFIDYPMYSGAKDAGEPFLHYGLQVLPCESEKPTATPGFEAVGIKYFEFQRRLMQAAAVDPRRPVRPETRDDARQALGTLVRARLGEDYCTAEVRVQRHRIERGRGYRVPDWERAAAWSLGGSS